MKAFWRHDGGIGYGLKMPEGCTPAKATEIYGRTPEESVLLKKTAGKVSVDPVIVEVRAREASGKRERIKAVAKSHYNILLARGMKLDGDVFPLDQDTSELLGQGAALAAKRGPAWTADKNRVIPGKSGKLFTLSSTTNKAASQYSFDDLYLKSLEHKEELAAWLTMVAVGVSGKSDTDILAASEDPESPADVVLSLFPLPAVATLPTE